MSQSNTRVGDFVVLAGESLVGKEGRLVRMTHDTQVPEVKLPDAVTDYAIYLVVEGAADAARQSLGERFPEVAKLNQKWAPWYGARDAFKTAAVRENRGVVTNLVNFANSPAFARGVDATGRSLGATSSLPRLLMIPSARDATSVKP